MGRFPIFPGFIRYISYVKYLQMKDDSSLATRPSTMRTCVLSTQYVLNITRKMRMSAENIDINACKQKLKASIHHFSSHYGKLTSQNPLKQNYIMNPKRDQNQKTSYFLTKNRKHRVAYMKFRLTDHKHIEKRRHKIPIPPREKPHMLPM